MTSRLLILMFGAWATATGCVHSGPTWTYAGPEGPPAWGTLDPSFATCGTGKSQSPINIVEVIPRDLPNILFRYTSAPVRLLNNGRAVEQSFDPGHGVTIGNMQYALQSMSIHTPSEHRAAGQGFPMEVQMLHKSQQGHLLVVSVMIKEGQGNAALGAVLRHLPTEPGDAYGSNEVLPLMQLLPKQRTYMRYSGSLTTPPCWENVMWVVLTEPVQASKAQINAFAQILPNNVRPVSPVGRRTVFMDATP